MPDQENLRPGEFYCELLFSSDGLEGINLSVVDGKGNRRAKEVIRDMLHVIKKHNNGLLSAEAGPVTETLGTGAKDD